MQWAYTDELISGASFAGASTAHIGNIKSLKNANLVQPLWTAEIGNMAKKK